jgi:putative ABC transport system permease protein
VRQALGARPHHIAWEILTETTLLALGGGVLGAMIGAFGIDMIRLLGTDNLPLGATIAFDARVAGVSLLVALAAGVVLAVPPIWLSLHGRIAAGLCGGVAQWHGEPRSAASQARIHCHPGGARLCAPLGGRPLGRKPEACARDARGIQPREPLRWRCCASRGTATATPPRARPSWSGSSQRSLALPGVTHAAITTGLPFNGLNQRQRHHVVEGQEALPDKNPFVRTTSRRSAAITGPR